LVLALLLLVLLPLITAWVGPTEPVLPDPSTLLPARAPSKDRVIIPALPVGSVAAGETESFAKVTAATGAVGVVLASIGIFIFGGRKSTLVKAQDVEIQEKDNAREVLARDSQSFWC
jgi:hypothetical protein